MSRVIRSVARGRLVRLSAAKHLKVRPGSITPAPFWTVQATPSRTPQFAHLVGDLDCGVFSARSPGLASCEAFPHPATSWVAGQSVEAVGWRRKERPPKPRRPSQEQGQTYQPESPVRQRLPIQEPDPCGVSLLLLTSCAQISTGKPSMLSLDCPQGLRQIRAVSWTIARSGLQF